MDDANYIIKNIAMLKRNTINVKNLTNKFCLELSRNFGIDRTENLENAISDLLTKYKKGEVDDDVVVASFKYLLDSTNEKSVNSNANNNINNSNTNKINQKKDVESSNKTNTEKDITVEQNEDIIVGNKNTNQQIYKEDIESNNTTNIRSTGSSNNIKQIVEETTDNRNGTYDVEESQEVFDVNTTSLGDVINICSGIEGSIEGAKITSSALVAKYAAPVIAAASEIASVASGLGVFKGLVAETVEAASDNDASYGDEILSNPTWDQIYAMYKKNKNSTAVRATGDFFKNCEIQGDFAILYIGGKECKYDMKKNKFYVDGKVAFDATIYVPSSNSNYSDLNVYTYFVENSDRSKNAIKDRQINNISIQIVKSGVNEKGDALNGAIYTKADEVALLTKFVNKAASTSKKCKNIIGGDSRFGAYSLKIAANADDGKLYDTVYVVNNAVIVRGLNGSGEKVKITEEELARLDYKDIYFISTSGDDNPAMNTKGLLNVKKHPELYSESYLYTGLKILCEACPHANVHMVYNDDPAGHDYLITILQDLKKMYKNYTYDSDKWYDCCRKGYTDHSSGPVVVNDLSETSVTNYNEFTA